MEEKIDGALLEEFKVFWQHLEFIPFSSTI